MRRLLGLSLAVGIATLGQAAPVHPPKQESARLLHGEIRCRLDERWLERDMWSAAMPLHAFLRTDLGPRMPVISIEKYPAGNGLYPTSRDFLASVGGGAESAKRGKRVRVAGRDVFLWERSFVEAGPEPGAGPAGAIDMRDRFVVLDQRDGFFVLRLRAPSGLFQAVVGDYEGFLASFARAAAPRGP